MKHDILTANEPVYSYDEITLSNYNTLNFCEDYEALRPDPLFNIIVLGICGCVIFTAGSGAYGLYLLARWVLG